MVRDSLIPCSPKAARISWVEGFKVEFSKFLTDPDFVAQAEKAKRPVASLEGKECETKAKDAWAAADAMKEVLKGLTK